MKEPGPGASTSATASTPWRRPANARIRRAAFLPPVQLYGTHRRARRREVEIPPRAVGRRRARRRLWAWREIGGRDLADAQQEAEHHASGRHGNQVPAVSLHSLLQARRAGAAPTSVRTTRGRNTLTREQGSRARRP